MRILMILENKFPPDVRVEKEIRSLLAAGHKIVLACSSPASDSKSFYWHGSKIIHKKMPKFVYKSSVACLWFPLYFNYWRRFLDSVVNNCTFDAIHLHDIPLAKVAKEFSLKYNIPFVLDLHENRPEIMKMYRHVKTIPGILLISVKRWFKYQSEYVKLADRIILITNEAKETFVKNDGLMPNKIVIVSNYVDLQKINKYYLDSKILIKYREKFTLVYFGDTGLRRGTATIIKAACLLKRYPNIHYLIIGKSKDDSKLRKLIKKCEVNNVELLGWIPTEKAVSYISASRVGLCPFLRNQHHDTTYANKMFQYMAFRKPVIVSDCISQKKLIEKEKCGLVFKANDADDLATKIKEIYQSSNYDQLAEYSLKAVEDKYNWETTSKNLIALYKEL